MDLKYLDTVDFQGYSVREDGLVTRMRDGLIIKPSYVINRNGRKYPTFRLTYDGMRHKWFAHRLMAWVFIGQGSITFEQFQKMIVDHIDNNPGNFNVWNVEILQGGVRENMRRRFVEFSHIPF